MQPGIISFKQVSKSFDKVVVHNELNFEINKAEVVTLLGPSGSGKTVILKLIIGLLRPSAGEICVFGRKIEQLDEDQLIEVRSKVGMLFQGAALFDSLSVFDNIAYALREAGQRGEAEISEIVHEKLQLVNLPNMSQKFPPELSGGQKKRVGLARALASSPKVVLFDEPTTGLDPTSVRMIDELIVRLRDEFGITSVVVTHDTESARRVSNRWILINRGYILADGPVEQVLAKNKNVHEFITGTFQNG